MEDHAHSEDLTFLDLALMRQFKGRVNGRNGPVVFVRAPGSPTRTGGKVEAVVPRGMLRGLIRATVLDNTHDLLSMWVTSCELTGFQSREARYRLDGVKGVVRRGKDELACTVVDVSLHGAGLDSSEEIEVGDLVVLQVEHDRRPLRASFRVVWSERPVGQKVSRYGLRLNEEIRLASADWKAMVKGLARRAA